MGSQSVDCVVSERGISFTTTSIKVMRNYLKGIISDGINAMTWYVMIEKNGDIRADLVGYKTPQPRAVEDRIEEMTFYWLGSIPTGFEELKKYCIDLPWSGPTELIPLSNTQKN